MSEIVNLTFATSACLLRRSATHLVVTVSWCCRNDSYWCLWLSAWNSPEKHWLQSADEHVGLQPRALTHRYSWNQRRLTQRGLIMRLALWRLFLINVAHTSSTNSAASDTHTHERALSLTETVLMQHLCKSHQHRPFLSPGGGVMVFLRVIPPGSETLYFSGRPYCPPKEVIGILSLAP